MQGAHLSTTNPNSSGGEQQLEVNQMFATGETGAEMDYMSAEKSPNRLKKQPE